MIIKNIYEKYQIPPNLQQHLLRVSSIAGIIADNWKNDSLDKKTLIVATLLHDLGNIIKFTFDRPDLLGEEGKNIEHWKEIKNKMIDLYGPDEHKATEIMCREIGVSKKVLYVISHIGFSKYEEIVMTDNWEVKVCTYSDHRTSPFGILPLKERLSEVIKRYKDAGRNSVHTSDQAPNLVTKALEVEKQIQSQVGIDLNSIKQQDVEKGMKLFELFDLQV